MDSKKEHSLTCEKCRKITTKITGDGGMTYGCSLFPGIVVGEKIY